MSTNHRGQIITFYSYKGGTGRTMALANVACILAKRQQHAGGKGVLMIDWDLEAPGLHRYFRNRTSGLRPVHNAPDSATESRPGLIDLFYELQKKLGERPAVSDERHGDPALPAPGSERLAREIIENVDLQSYLTATGQDGLSLLKAGRFNPQDPNEYPVRVNSFDWGALYNRSQHLIRVFAEVLAQRYAFVLVDSRTGVTDISGICTALMPDKLVVVFTPNTQSLKGGLEQISWATDYRKESADLRPLVVFPLVSRVEANEPDLRHEWRFVGDAQRGVEGYQTEFERLLTDIYGQVGIKLDKYFDEIQIQHIPRYAYGEEIAFLAEKSSDKFSLRKSYQVFASKLVEAQAPWEGEIRDVDSPEEEDAAGVTDRLRAKLSSRATRRFIQRAVWGVLFLLAVTGIVSSYYQLREATRVQQEVSSLQQELTAWQQELAAKQQELADLQGPKKLSARIEEVEFESARSPDGGTQVFILLSVRNYDSPTTVDNYALTISHVYSRSFEIKSDPVELKGAFQTRQRGRTVKPQESIQSLTAQALGKNVSVRGWLKFDLSDTEMEPEDLKRPGVTYKVSFADSTGKKYETTYVMDVGPRTAE